MAPMGVSQAIDDRLFERSKLRIVPSMKTLSLHKLPEPFDKVEVGGIRWQPEQGNPEAFRLGHDIGIALITGIV